MLGSYKVRVSQPHWKTHCITLEVTNKKHCVLFVCGLHLTSLQVWKKKAILFFSPIICWSTAWVEEGESLPEIAHGEVDGHYSSYHTAGTAHRQERTKVRRVKCRQKKINYQKDCSCNTGHNISLFSPTRCSSSPGCLWAAQSRIKSSQPGGCTWVIRPHVQSGNCDSEHFSIVMGRTSWMKRLHWTWNNVLVQGESKRACRLLGFGKKEHGRELTHWQSCLPKRWSAIRWAHSRPRRHRCMA